MAKSFGEKLIEGLQEFTDALKNDRQNISKHFNCHRIALDLCPTQYNPELVKQTRKLLGASQVVFAHFLGVSPNTVRAWEQGVNKPNDMACRFMDEIRRDPEYWLNRLKELVVPKSAVNTSSGGKKQRGAARRRVAAK